MSTVQLDPEHLEAVSTSLVRYSGALDDLLARARSLDAGADVAGLVGAPVWARGQAPDVRRRAELVRRTDAAGLGTTVHGARVRDLAGGAVLPRGVVDRLVALVTDHDTGSPWNRRSNESLDDWSLRVISEAIIRVDALEPLEPLLAEGLEWYSTWGGLVASWAFATASVTKFSKYIASPHLAALLRAHPAGGAISGFLHAQALKRIEFWGRLTAPGTSPGMLSGEVISLLVTYGDGAAVPPAVAARLPSHLFGYRLLDPGGILRIPGPLKNVPGNLFGRPWVNPAGETVLRGGSNLLEVGRGLGWGRLPAVARTSGALRGFGVVGGAAMTGYDVLNVYAQGNPVKAFEREGAGYVADLAQTGFDASMTAVMICPANPWAWAAVAGTGTVWAGAELIDHWDTVKGAAGDAAHWTGERFDDAAGAIGDAGDAIGDAASGVADKAGDTFDAVKDSKVNPMNWHL